MIMTQEQKDLLLKDLCARLPYGVICKDTNITEESIKKIRESINNESYYCNDAMEKQIVDEIVNILRDDKKFQEFSKQMMQKIILGE